MHLVLPLLLVLATNPYFERAQRLYAEQRFAEAWEQLKVARQVRSDDVAEQIEVLDLLARCQLAEGHPREAERSYEQLLQLDPRWSPPARTTSPKILGSFFSAKERLYPRGRAVLRVASVGDREVRVTLLDPWSVVERLRLLQRQGSGGAFTATLLPAHGQEVRLAFPVSAQPTAWYLEALDGSGGVRARLGSPEQPELLPASAPLLNLQGPGPSAPPPVARSHTAAWVLAGLAGGALAGAGVFQLLSRQSARAARTEPWADAALADQNRSVNQAHTALGLAIGAGAAGVACGVAFVW